jgi:dihydrofolate reductase
MGTLSSWLISSLDGVVAAPERWSGEYMNEEVNADTGAGLTGSGTVLLGRNTYLDMASFWPHQGDDNPFAAYLNRSAKYVVTSTLETLEWANSTKLGADGLAGEVTALKDAGDVIVLGSPTLVRWLLGQGLLDALTLNLCPVLLGPGLRLFDAASRASSSS